MGLHGSDRALMYALGKLARGAATRGGYVSQLPWIAIGGDWTGSSAARRVLIASLTISDLLNETPNTCTFTVQGARPTEGSDIVIGRGSRAASSRLFGGTILRVTEVVAGQNPTNPRNLLYQCEGIDYSWRLTATLVSARYRSQSATAIALDLLARFAPPGYASMIAPDLPDVDEITFTNTTLLECFSQLAGRVGGYAKVDYFRRLWLWTDLDVAMVPPPRALTPDHPSLEDVAYVRDLSPVVTRALVEGGGVNAIEECDPGETRIPVEDVAWYDPNGGHVVSGPQRITYFDVVDGGGGAMASAVGGPVGNTAPPSGPTVTATPGAGLPAGLYQYAYTWVTAAGESLPSPASPWNPGSAGGPTVAPGATPAAGTGLGTGTYKYAYTWTTAVGGETKPSPMAAADTSSSIVAAPAGAPTPTVQNGSGLPDGTYKYAVTFQVGTGETTPGPQNAATTSSSTSGGPLPNPSGAPGLALKTGDGLGTGTYTYAYTFVDNYGETLVGPTAAVTTTTPTIAPPSSAPSVSIGGSGGVVGAVIYKVTFVTGYGETTAGPMSNTVVASSPSYFLISNIPKGPAGTIKRNIYRTDLNGHGPFRLIYTLNDNTTTQFTEGRDDSWLGASEPGSNTGYTAINRQVTVNGIPPGPSGTTKRKVYRSTVNGGAGNLRLLATINNNTTTELGVDSLPDGSLGGGPPSRNSTGSTTTTYKQQVALTAIPIGPSGVTGRKIYRTTKGGTQLKLLQTIANNTATAGATDTTPDASLGANAPTTNTTTITAKSVQLSGVAAGPSGVTGRKIYRTAVGASALKFLATLANNTTTTYTDTTPDAALGAAPPTTGTAILALAVLSDVAIGAQGTTARRIYRTPKDSTALQYLGMLTDNVATTVPADAAPDTALGAPPPPADTSGLPSGGFGQVNAGASSMPVASIEPFVPEGWALVGGQLIRYHGTQAAPPQITGIPALGLIGSLGISIPYNSPIKIVSQLVGIPASGPGAIVETILQGDPVNLLVIHDDVEAQHVLASLLGGGADGVVEYYDQDRRISLVEANARADAWLTLKSRTLETLRYRVRDTRTQSGATVTVDLPALGVAGAFEIQDVTIAGFLGVADVAPTYTVVASSSRLTFEDLVRRLRRPAGGI